MNTLIKNNINHILQTPVLEKNTYQLKITTESLNKERFIIISWIIWSWKINFIKFLLNSTWMINKFFYYNHDIDIENKIKTWENYSDLFNTYKSKYNDPKIIILENVNNTPWIKDFISKIYKEKKYKLIIIWNSIKIPWIKEIEILPAIYNTWEKNINELITYWKLKETLLLENIYFKKRFLNLNLDQIIYRDIVKSFSVKNINLLTLVLTELSKINTCLSLRELHKTFIWKQMDISLITTIDYINYLLSSKLLKRSYTYDLKLKKEITSKAKYYFTDNWLLNSLNLFNSSKAILNENYIYSELLSLWYTIYNWKNWTFDFTFYAEKNNEKVFIHISEEKEDKNELKKEVRRLLKIPWNDIKYLVIQEDVIDKLKIKKFVYEEVRIVILEELIKELN